MPIPGLRQLAARPYLLLSLAGLMWGGNAVAGRLAVGEVSPMAITALRWLLVIALLAPIAGPRLWAERQVALRNLPMLFGLGALGYTAFNALFYAAAHHTSAVNIGVIQGIMPALVLLGSFAAYRTPIRAVQVVGLLLTLVGVAVTASRGDLDVLRRLAFNVGDVLMIVATVLYAGYTVALRARPPLSPLSFFAGIALAALVTSLPLLGWEAATGALLWPTPKGWAILVYIAVMPSLLAQLCYLRGVELIGPARAGLFINTVPVFAALLAVLLIGEHFAAYHAVALAFVLGGIWLAERGRR